MIEKIKHNKTLSIIVIIIIYVIAFAISYLCYRYLIFDNVLLKMFLFDVIATTLVFLGSMLFNNSSIYDPYWSVFPIFIVPFFILETTGFNVYNIIILVIIAIWAIRLTANCLIRFKNLTIQDWRYNKFQTKYPKLWPIISYFGIHMFPTLVVFIGLLPVFAYIDAFSEGNSVEINGTYVISIAVSIFAIVIEMIADVQMEKFKKDSSNIGKINRSGLWKKSRHPNYFGEIIFWFSMFLFCLAVRTDLWILIFSPLIIFLMFVFISIPMLDKKLLKSKSGYDVYQKETNALLPIFAPGTKEEK